MAEFSHRQSAHCESGVVANMVSHMGMPMSEPMAFGLASALTFAYLPVVKVSGMPLIAYRMPPGHIITGVGRRLGMRWTRQRFRDPARGMAALDRELDAGRVVGMQTSVYWLPYFPEDMRFQFNAHNLVVVGRDGGDYIISDPVFETLNRCDAAALSRARFVKGPLAPQGIMYFPSETPKAIDYPTAIRKAVRTNRRYTVQAPVPVIGVRGIRHLGRTVAKLGKAAQKDLYLKQFLGHVVRMQEEIGTGGAGFRFLYGAFLQEAATVLGDDLLKSAAHEMTEAGDDWRLFALQATKMCRGRTKMDVDVLEDILNRCADREAAVWTMLAEV